LFCACNRRFSQIFADKIIRDPLMAATLTKLVSFTLKTAFYNGGSPIGNLILDSNGDLFGTTQSGGAKGDGTPSDDGTVFEVVKTPAGYATTPTVLTSFNGFDGDMANGSLLADANGDLFGTTQGGGPAQEFFNPSEPSAYGTVFELVRTPTGYATSPTTLVSFNNTDGRSPNSGLITDSNGDLFGTTPFGGTNGGRDPNLAGGTTFEIEKTADGYASAPTTLFNFLGQPRGADPPNVAPVGGLIADASGDLFGAAGGDGVDNAGTVFEIAKTSTGYASPPTTLVGLTNNPATLLLYKPDSALIADANGDLFGTTSRGGVNGFGSVYEILKTAGGYASSPTTLASFPNGGGDGFVSSLIIDADGDLFGVASSGGALGNGPMMFEIAKTAAGYASTPRIVASLDGTNEAVPLGGLIADASGDLFGTTWGGTSEDIAGTVYEITDSGFVPTGSVAFTAPPAVSDLLFQNGNGQAAIWDMNGTKLIGGGAVSPNPGPGWKAVATGDFNDDGHADLLFQNANGQAAVWDMNGGTPIGGGPVSPNPGPAWKAVGTGDFNHDGHSDILWQNADGQAATWDMSVNRLIGGGAVTPNPGTNWKAIGTGDFNKDGFSDILWQNTNTGQISIWEMDGNNLVGGGPVTPNPGPSWQAIGAGDFNHDGFSDILFQNKNTGQVSVWEMDGTSLIGGGLVANPGTSWHAIGAGGGGSEILLQNTSGQTSIWEMNGNTIAGGGPVSPNPGPSWHAIGLT
jgi:FG-GAP-like repeat